MTKRISGKLNWLEQHLPEGLLVDAAWLSKHCYSTSLRSQYLSAGWLVQPVRGVYYRRLRGPLTWQQVVISLQTILGRPLVVGGRTALELQGYAHYLPTVTKEVHLYGPKTTPHWLNKLKLETKFVYHNDQKLFRNQPIHRGIVHLNWNMKEALGEQTEPLHGGLVTQPWGQWNWPLTLSTPERAIFELLDELPGRESFEQADKLMAGLTTLSPRRLDKLLADCKNVKVKRLFFFFADRHQHAWLKRLNKKAVDLGEGKRMLVRGGRLDPVYKITVPEALDAVS
jgi:hypothetical protein